eukprot:Gb_02963 [translate_table: standard]
MKGKPLYMNLMTFILWKCHILSNCQKIIHLFQLWAFNLSVEWRLQDELRNPELEKELEKRIWQRRDESGERDKLKDDDRDGEGKRYYSRDGCQKDDRYQDERQRDHRHRDGRYREDRNNNKHRDGKHREEQSSQDCAVDRYDGKHFRDGSRPPGYYKENKHYDNDQYYSSHFDDWCTRARDNHRQNRLTFKCGDSAGEHHYRLTGKCNLDEDRERISSIPSCSIADDVALIGNQQKRAHDIGLNVTQGQQRHNVKHVESGFKDYSFEESAQCTKGGRDKGNIAELQAHLKEAGILKSKNRTEVQLDSHGKESPLESARSPAYDGRTTPILSRFGGSPKSNGLISPVHVVEKSPSPSIHDIHHHLSNAKASRRDTLENGIDVRSCIGSHSQGSKGWHFVETLDKGKMHLGTKEVLGCKEHVEVCTEREKYRDLSPSAKESEKCRNISPSAKERGCNSPLNNSNVDDFSRTPADTSDSKGSGSLDVAFGLSRRHVLFGSAPSASAGGTLRVRCLEEMPYNRLHQAPLKPNRHIKSPSRPQEPSLPARPSSLLPPPPPFRPGIDNPSVLGPSSSFLEGGQYSKDQESIEQKSSGHLKRGDCSGGSGQWKRVANWNSQAHGPGPNNNFIPIHHQVGGIPHEGFHNMGQQYPGPPLFGGVRPSADMNRSDVRYHMHNGRDMFSGNSHAFGWGKQADDVCGPRVQNHLHTWDGPGSYADESHICGRSDWDQNRQGIRNRNWDQATDMWKGPTENTNMEFPTHRETDYQGHQSRDESWGGHQGPRVRNEKIRRERPPTESIEIKRSAEGPVKFVTNCPQRTVPSKERKPSRSGGDRTCSYLSKLDISAKLAGLDLYNQCVSLMGSRENMSFKGADMPTDAINEDLQLEVDTDAEALIHNFDPRFIVLPKLPVNVFERAMAVYRKVTEKTKVDLVVTSFENTAIRKEQLVKAFTASKGTKEEACCAPVFERAIFEETNTQYKFDYQEMEGSSANELACSTELTAQNDTGLSQEAPDTAIEDDAKGDDFFHPDESSSAVGKEPLDDVNSRTLLEDTLFQIKENVRTENMEVSETTSSRFRKSENSVRNQTAVLASCSQTVDSVYAMPTVFVELATTQESDCDSNKTGENPEGKAETDCMMLDSRTHSQVHESCAKGNPLELDAKAVICEHGNQVNEDFCAKTKIEMNALLANTEVTHEEAFESKMVGSKDEYRESVSQYNHPENTH